MIWLLLALLLLLFCYYIPGSVFLYYLGLRTKDNRQLILSVLVGVALFLLINYLFSYLKASSLVLLILSVCSVIYLFKLEWQHDFIYIKTHLKYSVIVIIALGSFLFILLNNTSGIVNEKGYQLRGTNARDGVLHIAMSKTMAHTFPPERPGYSGVSLQGYHYFYPFLVGKTHSLFNISIEDILFRIMPLILAITLGSSFYLFSTLYIQNNISRNLIVTFVYAGYGSISLLPPLDFPGMQYTVTLVHNPSTLLSISLLMAGWYAWLRCRENLNWAITAAVLLGTLAQIKVYAGIIAISSVCFYTLFQFFHFKKDLFKLKNYFISLLGIAFCTYITFYVHNIGSATLIWAPLRYIDHFMEQVSLKDFSWTQRKAIFQNDNNFIRITIMYLNALALFTLYHLGNRVFILAKIKNLKDKSFWTNPANQLLIAGFFVMITIPLLFIQSVAVFDIGQFLWIASVISAVPAGIGATILWNNRFGKIIVSIIVSVPFILGYISDFKTHQLSEPTLTVTIEEHEIYKTVTKNTHSDESIVFVPFNQASNNLEFPQIPIASAMTGRFVYYEQELTPFKSEQNIQNRMQIVFDLHLALRACNPDQFRKVLKLTNINNLLYTDRICDQIKSQSNFSDESNNLSFYKF